MKIRFKMKNPAGSLLFHGLRFSLRNWPCLLWAYAVNLGFGLLGGLPFSTGLADFINNNLPPRFFGNLNTTYFAWFFLHFSRTRRLPPAEIGVLALSVAELTAMLFVAAGTVHIYFAGERPTTSNLFLRGKAYFWRFVRISLFGIAIGGPLVAGLLGLRWLFMRHVLQAAPGRAAALSIASAAVVLLLVSPLRLAFDLIEVYTVRNGMLGNRRIRAAFRPALRLLGHHVLPMLLSFLIAGLLGMGFLTACLYLWKDYVRADQLWLAYLVSHLGFLLLLATRFWQRGMEVALALAAEPSIKPAVAQLEVQRTTSPSAEPTIAEPTVPEPTIQELVQKLKNEPWAKPAGAWAANSNLFQPPPKPLAPLLDADSAEEVQDSFLTEHVKNLPLLDPYAEESDAENPLPPPAKSPGRKNGDKENGPN